MAVVPVYIARRNLISLFHPSGTAPAERFPWRVSVTHAPPSPARKSGKAFVRTGSDAIAARDGASAAATSEAGCGGGAVCGGVGAPSAKETGRLELNNRHPVITGGTGIGKAIAAVKPRVRSRTTSPALAPASSFEVKDDIQRMVDQIKSRNRNNGGGRQANGGSWTRKRFSLFIFAERRRGIDLVLRQILSVMPYDRKYRGHCTKCTCEHRGRGICRWNFPSPNTVEVP